MPHPVLDAHRPRRLVRSVRRRVPRNVPRRGFSPLTGTPPAAAEATPLLRFHPADRVPQGVVGVSAVEAVARDQSD